MLFLAARLLLENALIRHPQEDEYDADQAEEVNEEAESPADHRQESGDQRGHHAAHHVHGRRVSHESVLLVTGEVVGDQSRGHRHDDTHANAHKSTADKQGIYVRAEARSTSEYNVKNKACQSQGTALEQSAQLSKKQVRDCYEQRGHADDELNEDDRLVAEMLLDNIQRGSNGGTRHYGQE